MNNQQLNSLLTQVFDKLHAIDKTLVKQEENLKIHIYRTELAEKRLEIIENDLSPVKKHVNMLEGGLKLLGIISLLIGIILGVIKIL